MYEASAFKDLEINGWWDKFVICCNDSKICVLTEKLEDIVDASQGSCPIVTRGYTERTKRARPLSKICGKAVENYHQ